jgi:hypothetical protein
VKRLVRHADRSPSSPVEVEYSWTCTSTPSCIQDVVADEAQRQFVFKEK